MHRHALATAVLALVAALASDVRANPIVRFTTSLGAFEVELCAEVSTVCAGAAPITVANFLQYVDEGRYPDTSFVHRRGAGPPSASPLVLQGGGYWVDPAGPSVATVSTLPPIPLETGTGLSNTRGTIAMARLGSVPDSATSQWFINLVDNVSLDTASGGWAVFGQIVGGLDVVDAIGALPIWNLNAPFNELPLIDYSGTGAVFPYLVYVTDIARVPEPGSVVLVSLGLAALARRRRTRAL